VCSFAALQSPCLLVSWVRCRPVIPFPATPFYGLVRGCGSLCIVMNYEVQLNTKCLLRMIAFDDQFAVKRKSSDDQQNSYPSYNTTFLHIRPIPSSTPARTHIYEQTPIGSLHRQDPAPITIQPRLAPAMNHGKAAPCTHSVPAPRTTQGPAITYNTAAKTDIP
jgi:hypothetical protein